MEECRKLITPEIKRNVELSMYIADRIFDILESKNMTQRQLAERLGKSESEISSWLTGNHTFTTKTIAKIEVAFGEEIFHFERNCKPQIVVNVNYMYETKRVVTPNNWQQMSSSGIKMHAINITETKKQTHLS